jgi:hypothetical protein
MHLRFKSSWSLAAVTAAVVALPVHADQSLNAAQLKQTFSNKTVSGSSNNGGALLTYFSADGKLTQKAANGELKQGTWRVTDQGQQCITWAGQKEACSTVVARGDGTYQRFVGDKATVTIHKMRDGNLLNQ